MNDQYNGPGFHLSLGPPDPFKPRRLTKQQRAEQRQQADELAAHIAVTWVPCVRCGKPHPPDHGPTCIVCDFC